MRKSTNNRLNIFVDETGEFGFGKGSAKLYGISLEIRVAINELRSHRF